MGATGLDLEPVIAAVQVRNRVGRLNDVIHAGVIAQSLRHILEPGEVITNRPSLAAGNDPTPPFDLETDRRVAEFRCRFGRAPMRCARAGRLPTWFISLLTTQGATAALRRWPQPIRFLRTSKSTADWALNRSSAFHRDRFT